MIKPTENSSLTNVASFMEQPISAQEEQHLKMLNQQQAFNKNTPRKRFNQAFL